MRRGSVLQRVVLTVLAVGLPIALWDRRGAVAGLVGVAIFPPVFLAGAFAPDRLAAWSRRHVALDAALFVPLAFACLAYVTDLALLVCALVALALGAVVIPLAVRRRGSRPPRSPSR